MKQLQSHTVHRWHTDLSLFIFKHRFFVCLFFVYASSFCFLCRNVSYCTFEQSGLLCCSLCCVCVCLSVRVCVIWSTCCFYCDELMLPDSFFSIFIFLLVDIWWVAFVLFSVFVFLLLAMSWPNASKSYTNWTIKEL